MPPHVNRTGRGSIPTFSGDPFASNAATGMARYYEQADKEAFQNLKDTQDYEAFSAYMTKRLASMDASDPRRDQYQTAYAQATLRNEEKGWSDRLAKGENPDTIEKEIRARLATAKPGTPDYINSFKTLTDFGKFKVNAADNLELHKAMEAYGAGNHEPYRQYLLAKLDKSTDQKEKDSLNQKLLAIPQPPKAPKGPAENNPSAHGTVGDKTYAKIRSDYDALVTQIQTQQKSGTPATPEQLAALQAAGDLLKTSLLQLSQDPKKSDSEIRTLTDMAHSGIGKDLETIRYQHDAAILSKSGIDLSKVDKFGQPLDTKPLSPDAKGAKAFATVHDITVDSAQIGYLAPQLIDPRAQKAAQDYLVNKGQEVKAFYKAQWDNLNATNTPDKSALAPSFVNYKNTAEAKNGAALKAWDEAKAAWDLAEGTKAKTNPNYVKVPYDNGSKFVPPVKIVTSFTEFVKLVDKAPDAAALTTSLGLPVDSENFTVLKTAYTTHSLDDGKRNLATNELLTSWKDFVAHANSTTLQDGYGLDLRDESTRALRTAGGNIGKEFNDKGESLIVPNGTDFAPATSGLGFTYVDQSKRSGPGGKPQPTLISGDPEATDATGSGDLTEKFGGAQSPDAMDRNATDHIGAGLDMLEAPHPIADVSPFDFSSLPDMNNLPPVVEPVLTPAVTPLDDEQSPDAKERNQEVAPLTSATTDVDRTDNQEPQPEESGKGEY